jgi:hypothetical protein
MSALKKLEFSVPSKIVMTNDEYHEHPAIGSTLLKKVLRSPLHYKYAKDFPEEKAAFEFGKAVHTALLEHNVFESLVAVAPKFEGTGSRAAREKWHLQNEGKIKLKESELEDIKGIRKSVLAHKTATSFLADGAAEESYFDQCSETGLVRKARPDFLHQGRTIVDIKTTRDASPGFFFNEIKRRGYHISAAYYLDVVSNVLGKHFDDFVIIAVEKTAPYGVAVYRIDSGQIDAGRSMYMTALRKLKQCKATDSYPGYPDEVMDTSMPDWAFPQNDETETEDLENE